MRTKKPVPAVNGIVDAFEGELPTMRSVEPPDKTFVLDRREITGKYSLTKTISNGSTKKS